MAPRDPRNLTVSLGEVEGRKEIKQCSQRVNPSVNVGVEKEVVKEHHVVEDDHEDDAHENEGV
jgi:hypothetical protein